MQIRIFINIIKSRFLLCTKYYKVLFFSLITLYKYIMFYFVYFVVLC